MIYVFVILAGLILINLFLLIFSCNGCEKINNQQKHIRFQQPKQEAKLQKQMAFDK
jgi:hypothetical protein